MAKVTVCLHAIRIRALLVEGADAEARREAIKLLHDGFSSRPFLDLVAELLEPPKRGRGAPSHPPKGWVEMHRKFEKLRDEGISHQEALEDVAEAFEVSARTVGKAVRLIQDQAEAGRTED